MERTDPDAAIDRTADDLEQSIEKLDKHIDEAKSAEKAYVEEFPASESPAGDVRGEEAGSGESPSDADEQAEVREDIRED